MLIRGVLAVGVAMAAAGAAKAQADDSLIIVTGSLFRFEQPPEAAQSVSVLDNATLALRNVQSVEEALRYIPSVQAELAPGRGFDEFLVRGFNQSRYQFRDGLRLDPGYLQQQDVAAIDRIEVLKGPASVLYGQIAPGGLVNMVSKLPGKDFRGQLSVTGGNLGLVRVTGDLGGALDREGQFSARVNMAWQQRDDRTVSVESDRFMVAPSLMWQPSSDTSLAVQFLYQRDRYDRLIGLPIDGSLRPSSAGRVADNLFLGEPGLPQIDSRQAQLGYLFTHRFAPQVLMRSSLRYSWFDLDGPIIQAPRPGSTPTLVNRRGFDYVAKRRMLSTDNRIEAGLGRTGAIEHRVMFGFDWQRYRDTNSGELFGLALLNPIQPVYGAAPVPIGPFFSEDVTVEQTGFYGQYQARIDGGLILSLGARSSWSRTDRNDVLNGGGTVQSDRDTTFSAGVVYQAPGGFTPYVSFAQSFEPQVGFDPLPAGGLPPPARGEQWEAGLRWAPVGSGLSLQIAAFTLQQTNIVNGDLANPGFSILTGAQRHRGIEVEGRAQVGKAIDLTAAWTLLDAIITSSTNGDQGLTPIDVPRHSANLYATLLGSAVGLDGSSASLGIRHVGSRRANDLEERLPAFTSLDAALRYDFKPFSIALHVKNLTNERFFTGGGLRSVQIGAPRTFELIGSARF
jgi:iron complex outermembrane receptor protein